MNTRRHLLILILVLAAGTHGPARATTLTDTRAAAFEASVGSPFRIDLDTGWLPTGSDLSLRAFFYASAGEAHARYAGTFTASWDSSYAIPGNTVTVTLTAAGNPDDSSWASDGGLRYGMRYKIDTRAGRVSYRKEEYVPRLPNLDLSFPCPADTFLSFGLGQLLPRCSVEFGAGGNCLLSLGDDLGTCYQETAFQLNPDVGFLCTIDVPDDAQVDTVTNQLGEVEIKLRPTPPISLSAGVAFGICFDLAIGADRITHPYTGQTITSPTGSMTFDVAIPCDLANRTEGSPREHHFDINGIQFDADAVISLVGRLNPTFAACLAELVEVSIAPNVGICYTFPVTINLPDFDFPDADLGFTMPIADPVVRDIRPNRTVSTNFVDPIQVTWNTSWDQPDNKCNLQVNGYYRFTEVSNDPWKKINNQQPQPNTGQGDWDLSGQVFAGCRKAQLRIDLLDPRGKFLATANSDTFLIDVDPPVVVALQPQPGDMVCAGDVQLISWTLPPASCAAANPDSLELWLETSGGQIHPIAQGLPGTTLSYLWTVVSNLRSDANASIVIQAVDEAGNIGQDVIQPIGFNVPATLTIDSGGDPLGLFPVGGVSNPFGTEVEEGSLPGTFGICPNGNFQVEFGYLPQLGSPPAVAFEVGPGLSQPGIYGIDFNVPGEVIPFQFSVLVHADPANGADSGGPKLRLAQVDTFRATVRSTVGPLSEFTRDMLINVGTTSGSGNAPRSLRDVLVAAIPNPFNPTTRLVFELQDNRTVTLEIFDVAGRRVQTLLRNESLPRGRGEVVWRGRDKTGREVASGVYLARLTTEQVQQGLWITLVR